MRRADRLRFARNVLSQMPGQAERIGEIDRLIDRIEPARERARASVRRSRRPARDDLFSTFARAGLAPPTRNIEDEEVETRRQVFRSLAGSLLDDDPLVARSVLRSLDQPKPYEPQCSNVVQLTPTAGRLAQWSVRQFVYQGHLLGQDPPRPDFSLLQAGLATRLVEAGIETVAELLATDVDGLIARGILGAPEVRALSRALVDYDLRLTRRVPDGTTTRPRDREAAQIGHLGFQRQSPSNRRPAVRV